MLTQIEEALRIEARKYLATIDLFEYCKLMHPSFYKDDRQYLKDLCSNIQSFLESEKERFLVINLPPRHGKSYTATNTTAWLFGKDPTIKVMTASYNEILSTNFAKQVRDTIDTKKVGNKIVFNDIFPKVKIKKGDSSASLWSLKGNTEKNYLATSPSGTATGLGCKIFLCDDILKSAEDAYNERVLDKHAEWFFNTIMQRLEGNNWKVIIIMTRWATNDLAGKILENYKDVKKITYKAVQDDGSMLCNEILNRKDYDLKTQEMNVDIVEANYQQEPIDIKGRLYGEFKEWESLPNGKIYNQTDTADTGNDYLCAINYIVSENEVYVIDVLYTQEPMEETEKSLADMLLDGEVNEATIESNNGGRGFARNVKRIMEQEYRINKTIIKSVAQTKNKESRILTASGWVSNHVYMPRGWKYRYPEFYKAVTSYQRKGKNAHDDACFVAGTMISTIFGDKPIEQVKVGDRVITPFGIKKVLDSRLTGIKNVIEKDGLIATPDHKIFNGNKFIELDVFTGVYDIIGLRSLLLWTYKKLLYLMDGNSILLGKKNIILVAQQPIKDERILSDCMWRFGNIIVERKFLKAILFIIKTTIHLTTTTITWNVYQLLNTLKNILKPKKVYYHLKKLWKWLANGTKAKLEGNGTDDKPLTEYHEIKNSNVNIVTKNSNLHIQILDSVANHTQVNIEDVMEKDANVNIAELISLLNTNYHDIVHLNVNPKRKVYNLTVEDAHCFYANGKLVANCDVLSSIFEKVTGKLQPKILSKSDYGIY